MVSKSQIKLITSLGQKKYRERQGLFVVEGIKGITEFLKSHFQLYALFTVEGYFDEVEADKKNIIEEGELKKISFLKTPQKAVAIFHIASASSRNIKGLKVALDDIRDPGNLGTIIRLCDWFGIDQLVCSTQTVDCYNPKVIQATMGSLTRVQILYTDLSKYLEDKHIPVYGAFMEGENVYKTELEREGILVMGNEANGISSVVERFVTKRIAIPQFGGNKTESLNVATAAAILMSEFKRG